jgi:prolyl-tRNA synthetase
MGSSGIGVERAIAAIVEANHDERGIVWPASVAPFAAVVVVAQPKDAEVAAAGERVYAQLLAAGVEIVLDDRAERAGVKFRDAELVGIPQRITVGRRAVDDGTVELTDRATGETQVLPLDAAVKALTG